MLCAIKGVAQLAAGLLAKTYPMGRESDGKKLHMGRSVAASALGLHTFSCPNFHAWIERRLPTELNVSLTARTHRLLCNNGLPDPLDPFANRFTSFKKKGISLCHAAPTGREQVNACSH